MIDVCLIVHKNYELLRLQLEHWRNFKDFRLLVADNTPVKFRQPIDPLPAPHRLFIHDITGDDGETHGSTLDFLVNQAQSDIVGIVDHDFFITHPHPWAYMSPYFDQGCQAVGVEAYNEGWKRRNEMILNDPLGAEMRYILTGYAAPCVYCCFFTRQLALSETFVVTHVEGRIDRLETGWRMRWKIVKENIPHHVIPAFQYPGQNEKYWDTHFYGAPAESFGFHLVAGTKFPERTNWVVPLLEMGRSQRSKTLRTLKNKHIQQKTLLEHVPDRPLPE